MDSLSLTLTGCEISAFNLEQNQLRLHIARADLIKTLTGSAERTRWWQAGMLVLENAVLESPLPKGAVICIGGDLDDNIYTYRDMLPIPLASRGHIRCELQFAGIAAPFIATSSGVQLTLHDSPKYIEHLR
ncbi:hypothetical protein CKO09_08620 [Chromatium weissei]|nr:hypothetical protein [Chromatium weissei]